MDMDKVFMSKKHGIAFYASTTDNSGYLRLSPIIHNTQNCSLFKVIFEQNILKVDADYYQSSIFTKTEIKAIQTCILKAMQEKELTRLFKIALKAVYREISEIPFNERSFNQQNIELILDDYIYKFFIEEI